MNTKNHKPSERNDNPTWSAYMKRQQDYGLSKYSHNNHFENKSKQYRTNGIPSKLSLSDSFAALVLLALGDQSERLIQFMIATGHLVEQVSRFVAISGPYVIVAFTCWTMVKMIQRLPRG